MFITWAGNCMCAPASDKLAKQYISRNTLQNQKPFFRQPNGQNMPWYPKEKDIIRGDKYMKNPVQKDFWVPIGNIYF